MGLLRCVFAVEGAVIDIGAAFARPVIFVLDDALTTLTLRASSIASLFYNCARCGPIRHKHGIYL